MVSVRANGGRWTDKPFIFRNLYHWPFRCVRIQAISHLLAGQWKLNLSHNLRPALFLLNKLSYYIGIMIKEEKKLSWNQKILRNFIQTATVLIPSILVNFHNDTSSCNFMLGLEIKTSRVLKLSVLWGLIYGCIIFMSGSWRNGNCIHCGFS